jgi:hypothetical protein
MWPVCGGLCRRWAKWGRESSHEGGIRSLPDLPPPVNADYSFASYRSKTEVRGNSLKYTRTSEVKELSVPLSKVEDLRKLYRIIASDERNTAVLKPATH